MSTHDIEERVALFFDRDTGLYVAVDSVSNVAMATCSSRSEALAVAMRKFERLGMVAH